MSKADRTKLPPNASVQGVGDTAVLWLSNGRNHSYSRVKRNDPASITFEVTADVDTKTFELLDTGRFVRIADNEEMGDGGFGD